MTDNSHGSPRIGRTIILIGGPMTVDDGSTLDSRQPVTGDPGSSVRLASLASSLLWWTTVSSLVGQILDSAGNDPYALVIGKRSVVELRQDGRLRRTALRSILSGGTTTVKLIRTHRHEPLPAGYTAGNSLPIGDEVGFSLGEPGQRWRFLDDSNEFYMPWAGPKLGAAIIVDTRGVGVPTETDAGPGVGWFFESLESRRLYCDDIVLVMPHTYLTETVLRGYAKWVNAGRPHQFLLDLGGQPRKKWDPTAPPAATAPPHPIAYAYPVTVQADFKVTGLVQDGQWQDPSDLEAARSLLQARYDLKIGIWDLVGNATLRRTLLEAAPSVPPPRMAVEIPRAAFQRAESEVAAKIAEAEAIKHARSVAAERLQPLLEHGWKPRGGGSWKLYFPMTELVLWRLGSDPVALVQLVLMVLKRQCTVGAFTFMSSQFNIEEYVLARRALFEEIAAPDSCPVGHNFEPTLWRGLGGWADDVDWGERTIALVERTQRWSEAFKELCDDCYRVRPRMHEPIDTRLGRRGNQ